MFNTFMAVLSFFITKNRTYLYYESDLTDYHPIHQIHIDIFYTLFPLR